VSDIARYIDLFAAIPISLMVVVTVIAPIAYVAVLGTGKRGRNARKVLAMILRHRPRGKPPEV